MNEKPGESRPLPHHDYHRRRLLAAITAETTPQQVTSQPVRSRQRGPAHPRGWVRPAFAAAAVLAVIGAGVGTHALLRPASQPVRPGAGLTPSPTRSSRASRPTEVGSGEWSLTRKYTVTAPVSSLIVTDATGSVSVTAGSGSEVSVTATIYYRTSRPSISHAVTGRTLGLGYSACTDCGVAFTVTVPRATSVTIDEHTGSVTVANLAGDVSVQDGSGLITGIGLAAARASFRDQTGMIDVAFAAAPDRLMAASATGMVSIRVPSGTTYKVSATSQTGLVSDSVPQSPTATHVITATTGTGMVSVSTG